MDYVSNAGAAAEAEPINRKSRGKRTLLKKEGQSNLLFKGIKQKRVKYMKDIYVTLLDIKWRYAIIILFAGFLGSYFLFSIVYYLMSYVHGDIANANDPAHIPCIVNLKTYWDALLFSIETQSTLGYGTIYPAAECSGTVPVVFLQITLGFLIETMLLGFVFVKIARPKHRRHTLIFSQNACICQEDNQLTLQIRVGDIRNTHLIDTHLFGVLVKRYMNQEKYVYPLFQHEIEFEAHGMGDRLFLIWPMIMRHKITAESPLYTLTPEELERSNFELLILLEGTIESTGEMVQTRTSFTNLDILWGHRFAHLEEYDEKSDKWCIDFLRFNSVVPAKTPWCSAKDLDDDHSRLDEGGSEEGLITSNIRENSSSQNVEDLATIDSTAVKEAKENRYSRNSRLIAQCSRMASNTAVDSSDIADYTESELRKRSKRCLNRVTLIGRVGKDPEHGETPEHPCVIFPLATNVQYRKADGERMLTTDWHRLAAIRPGLRDCIANKNSKGDRLCVEGSLAYIKYTDQDKPFTTVSINADEIMILRRVQAPSQASDDEN